MADCLWNRLIHKRRGNIQTWRFWVSINQQKNRSNLEADREILMRSPINEWILVIALYFIASPGIIATKYYTEGSCFIFLTCICSFWPFSPDWTVRENFFNFNQIHILLLEFFHFLVQKKQKFEFSWFSSNNTSKQTQFLPGQYNFL